VQPRTLMIHAEYLATHGWIGVRAKVTVTGSRRAAEFWLRHGFPRWGIVNPDATTPTRDHGVTGGSVARSTHYPASNDVGRSTRRESTPLAAFNASRIQRCSAFNA
jgi:hypothetical protein